MGKSRVGKKLYYSISEVAEITDLQPYTLRAWEKDFTCLRPRRARGKNRAYRERDIGIVLLIKQLLYEERYTTKGVKLKLKNEPELLQSIAFDPLKDDPRTVADSTPCEPILPKGGEEIQVHSILGRLPVIEKEKEVESRQTEQMPRPSLSSDQPNPIIRIKKELREILDLL